VQRAFKIASTANTNQTDAENLQTLLIQTSLIEPLLVGELNLKAIAKLIPLKERFLRVPALHAEYNRRLANRQISWLLYPITSARNFSILSLFEFKLENCLSHTSLNRARTFRLIVSWSSKIDTERKLLFHFSCWYKLIVAELHLE
jgi:hypothetical protein